MIVGHTDGYIQPHPRYAFKIRNAFLFLLGFGSVAAQAAHAQTATPGSGIIITVAGNGTAGSTGNGGAATGAEVHTPKGVALDSSGNIYIVDQSNNCIRKVTVSTGIIAVVAGNGTAGYSGDGGQAVSAELNRPEGVAVDGAGNIYIADDYNSRIRKVTAATGVIATLAGNGTYGYSGDGSAATSAALNGPTGVAVDASGNVYIADYGNSRVRKITVSTGIISTVAGSYTNGFSGDGGLATNAFLNYPTSVALDTSGNIYIADYANSRVRKVTASTGLITTVAGNGTTTPGSPSGSATSAGISVSGLALDSVGNIYIADRAYVDKVTASTGSISAIAGDGTAGYSGDGGAATSAGISFNGAPVGMAVNSAGVVYFSDYSNRIRAIGPIKAAPAITWAAPAPIVYGTLLSSTQLNASAGSVAGTWSYSPGAGALLSAGTQTLSATFTPTADTIDYAPTTVTNTLVVNKATPTISWTAPAAITYGTSLSATQLDATSSTPGTFAYSPAMGAIPSAGTQTLSTTFTPTDTTDFNGATGQVSLVVNKASTVTQVSSSPNPSVYSNSVSLSSVVDTGGQTPTGQVTFKDGSTTLGTGTVSAVSSTNFVLYSQQIGSGSSWGGWCGPTNITNNTSAVTAPDGSSTATRLIMPTYSGTYVCGSGGYGVIGFISGGIQTGSVYTVSVWMRGAVGGEQVSLGLDDGNNVIETLTTTWQRYVYVSPPYASSEGNRGFQAVDDTQSGATFYMWGPQTEKTSSVGPYVATSATTATGTGGMASLNVSTLTAGSHSVTATYAGDSNYTGSTSSALSQAVSKAVPAITWQTPAAITVGVALSSTQLDATANVPGTFSYSPASGTVLPIGSQTLTVTFTPTDTTDYVATTASVTLAVNAKVTPTITWSTPSAITYGTALSATQLNATASVPGTFVYTPASGAVLNGGTQTLSATFTPTDTVDYNNNTKTVSLVVNKATPTIVVTTSGTPTTYSGSITITATMSTGPTGTVTFYDGGASIGTGTLSGTKATLTTTTLAAGSHTITAGWAGNTNYNAVTSSALTQVVNKATPQITWPTPVGIVYGTALSATQLNATANTAGTFAYSPASGTILTPGSQTLSVTFTPTNTTDYTTATGSVTIQVGDATPTLTITTSHTPSTDGTSVTFTATISNSLTGTVTFYDGGSSIGSSSISGSTATLATTHLAPGTHYITASWPGNADYNSVTSTYVTQIVQGNLIYSYTVPAGGYDGAGNLKSYADSVMGTWNFSYDTLNRLVLGTDNQTGNPSTHYCWGYDAFGNRTIQAGSSAVFATGSPAPSGSNPCQPATGASYVSTWANYNTTANNNQLTSTSQATGGVTYDASGDVTNDGNNQYLYDGEGRICATSTTVAGITTMTGYIYGADGFRVAKGSITAWSCDPSANGFSTTNDYVLGPGGEQVTEMTVTANHTLTWSHTNVWAGGKLIATYDTTGTGMHFYADDPLGTRRSQVQANGTIERTCSSLPFGDGETCNQTPTEHLFTGKERDAETGNDYFGARYYASSMGRWISPDPAMESEILENPQTWNRYSYVYNRPLYGTDPDGRCPACIGAIVGGIAEGGWNLGSQLISNGGHLDQVDWREVGANTVGGAITGGIAGATGGLSLLGDAAVGAGANVLGGEATRLIEGKDTSASDVVEDAVAGYAAGTLGHVAADLVHIPEVGPKPKAYNNKAAVRRMAKYNAQVAKQSFAKGIQTGVGTGAGTPPAHTVNGAFWLLDLFGNPPPPPPPPPPTPPGGGTGTVISCQTLDGQPCM